MVLDDDVTFTDLYDVIIPNQIKDDDLTKVEYQLPPHQRRASHILSLVLLLMWTSICCHVPFPKVYIKVHLGNAQDCGTRPLDQHFLHLLMLISRSTFDEIEEKTTST